ncbi:CCA tRNA nucleotidyltransferase [Devosia sp.]|uniref:CCA tRNA nucleotidyltransferase n=1 Tax=Devosia sp. TaxID=1871048 RepID=UPI002AFDE570|nr:CCA tRNA nucleotidyltransferase [Devosia sp.]
MPEGLEGAPWLARPQMQAIFAALDGKLRRTRAVGGAVRDTLLGRPAGNDVDLATELLPEAVMARAQAVGIAAHPTGITHGTVTLVLGEALAEVTTLRRDVETDGRHAQVAFGTDWVEDAKRRDFTLNALYCAADGTLYDPLGGLADLRAGIVRFIGSPEQRIAEDGLRVFRFFRFSASHGGERFEPEGLAACAEAVNRLDHLSRERIGHEMVRMLGLPRIATTLQTMAGLALLSLSPQALAGLRAYEALGGSNVATRLALVGGEGLDGLQPAWRLSNPIMNEARAIRAASALLAHDRIGEAAYRQGEAAVEGLALAAAENDWSRDRLAEAARMLAALVVPSFPISGTDLAETGIAPGPALGRELRRLEQLWIDSGFALGKPELLAEARL